MASTPRQRRESPSEPEQEGDGLAEWAGEEAVDFLWASWARHVLDLDSLCLLVFLAALLA